ncbi:hypothetical protein [Phytoactinopolyspora halotolerans]|uniref:Uncharacterized protein n=1 Tax=Phytoactinopolyspora halotolerans TaxID=1981512 RepID=A0A6L9SDW6_9ACTN|nr:hypothetical protein [Phytoactinopolyspora halotolerans]NEE03595.1 hypothetical protein [Phytoactinopolyspora halotolerans]
MTTQMTGPSGEEPRGEGTRYDTESLAEMLRAAAHQARSDITHTDDPKAQALLETSAEVLLGLVTAFEHYAEGREPAWR